MTTSLEDSVLDTENQLLELFGSPASLRILWELESNGPLGSLSLREACELSTDALIENVAPLMDRGWITQRAEHTYAITASGSLALQEFHHATVSFTVIDRLQPILEYLPITEFDIPLRLLDSAELTIPDSGEWFEMWNETTDRMANTNSFAIMTPHASPGVLRQLWDEVSDGPTTVDYVISEAAAEVYRNHPRFAEQFTEILHSDPLNIYVATEPLPFYIRVFEEAVQIGVFDEDLEPKGLLTAEQSEAICWGDNVIKRFRDAASLLD